jgi:pilus assembly protein CpaE
MARYSDTLFVLSAEEEIGDAVDIDPRALELLVSELRNKYHYLIADLPEPMSPMAQGIVQNATHLVLVTDLSLAGMRDTLRISQAALQANASCQLTVVVNRAGEHRAGEIAVAEFEKAIARPIDVIVPFDPKTVAAAMNVGRPVSRDRGRVATAIGRVADRLTGTTSKRDGGLLGRMLQRKG